MSNTPTPVDREADLSPLLVILLKGVVYQEANAKQWSALVALQAKIRDYFSLLGLELILDESEGYAFLRSRPLDEDDPTSAPRLISRRPLSFPVSLLLALLRKKLAELDTRGAETRLVLSHEQIVDLVRVFLPSSSNEAKLIDQIETHVNKVVELGFLRRLKPATGSSSAVSFEVLRILKAYVDAQWLADFDERLASYRARLESVDGEANDV